MTAIVIVGATTGSDQPLKGSMLTPPISRPAPTQREAFILWLDDYHSFKPFKLFVTLATNDPMMTVSRADHLIKQWDARMNRKLAGPKWQKHQDDRIWAFYFLEKPNSNPHWHGLVRFDTCWPDLATKQAGLFDEAAHRHWNELLPRGSVNVQLITDAAGIHNYVAKELGHTVSYEHFVTPDQFC